MSVNKKIKSIARKTRVSKNRKMYGRKKVIIDYKIHRSILIILLVSLLFNVIMVFLPKNVVIKEEELKEVEKVPENIVYLGDSITNRCDLGKYYPNHNTVNSGAEGNTTEDILNSMYERVYRYNPSIVVLLIGTNDISQYKSEDEIFNNIKEIVNDIRKTRSKAMIYVESILPTNSNIDSELAESRPNNKIDNINSKLKNEYKNSNIKYIDINKDLKDENGLLKEEYTEDGLHLTEEGYEILTEKVKNELNKPFYINNTSDDDTKKSNKEGAMISSIIRNKFLTLDKKNK